jgi:ABC-type transporter Mla subunit MlaD
LLSVRSGNTISSQEQRDQRAQRRAAVAERARQTAAEARRRRLELQQQPEEEPAMDAAIAQAIADAVAAVRVELQTTQRDLATAQQELAQARTDLATLQNAQPQQQPAPPAAVQPAPAQQPTFALGPATLTGTFIDYNTPAGIKLYKMAGDKLKSDFDLETSKFPRFIDNLNSRAIEQGWNSLLAVPHGGIDMNILRNYGTITYPSILAHANSYAFQDVRLAQNSTNLFNCLEATLTDDAMATIYAEHHIYTLKRGSVRASQPVGTNYPAGNDTDEFRDGLLLLWTVINRTTAQTNATISAIINQLTRMNSIMEESKHDIKQFNTTVRTLLNSYVANRRHEYDETILINSLFASYKTTKDREFTLYITRKQQDHDDNTKTTSPNVLMEDALKFYQTRITTKEWEQDTAEVKEIINLSAQLKASQGKLAALEKKWDSKGKEKDGEKKKEKKTGKGKGDNKYEGLTPEQIRKKRHDEAPDWMKVRPAKPSSSSRLEKDGNTYKWCDKHRMWCYHDTSECKLKKKQGGGKNESSSNKNEGGGSNKDNPKDGSGAGSKVTYGPTTSMVLPGWEHY